jgi:hypothetical protein
MANVQIAKSMIKEAIIEAIKKRAKKAWDGSQTKVPVRTGNLKNTGSNDELTDGSSIKYPARYASYVERGVTARYVDVRGYWHPNGYYVHDHKRWQPKRKGKKFIEKPLKDEFKTFGDELDSELKAKFTIVIRR